MLVDPRIGKHFFHNNIAENVNNQNLTINVLIYITSEKCI